MKKITLILVALYLTLISFAQTSFPVDETFATGFPNPSSTGQTVTANDWTTVTGAGFSNSGSPITKTTTTSLTYIDQGNTKTWMNSGLGNALYVNYTGVSGSTNTNYSSKSFSATPITSGILYLSFLYKCTANGGSGSQILGISDQSASVGSSGAVVYCGYTSPNLKLGVVRGAASNTYVQWISSSITLNTVYFVVLKYDMTVTPVKASLYINPTLGGTEPASPAAFDDGTVNLQAARTAGFQYLKQCNSGSNKAYFNVSGVRVSQSWSDAVAPYVSVLPNLNTPTVGSPQNIADQGFTATWTNGDALATGFKVNVYAGTNILPVNTTNALAGSTSAAITGLLSGIDYTFKVTAVGDNQSYQNSAESASSSVTTSGRVNSINVDFGTLTWQNIYNSTDKILTTGSYPSSYENGFELNKTGPYFVSNNTGPRGEIHSTYLKVDKINYSGNLVFPTVSNVSQLEIHAYPATPPRDFSLKQYINGAWIPVGAGSSGTTGQYTMTSSNDSIFIIPITANNTNAKFKIDNLGSGGINILQVIARSTNPSKLTAPTISVTDVAGNISSTGFTANWSTGDVNAQGYKVFVYAGTTLVNSFSTTNDNTTRNLAITGLTPNTAYTYKVLSMGDGDNSYSDSYLSNASAGFLTLTDSSTGIDDIYSNINIYASNKVIYTSESGLIQVFNLQGGKMLEACNVNKLKTNLPEGIYIIKFTGKNEKVIIAKVKI